MIREPRGEKCSAAEINNIDVLQIMRAAGWTKDYVHHMHNVRAVFSLREESPKERTKKWPGRC